MFQKGKPKTGGRKKGVQNKSTTDIAVFARSVLEDEAYRDNLRLRIIRNKATKIEELLYHYAYGKPHDKIDIGSGPDPCDFTLTIDSNGV